METTIHDGAEGEGERSSVPNKIWTLSDARVGDIVEFPDRIEILGGNRLKGKRFRVVSIEGEKTTERADRTTGTLIPDHGYKYVTVKEVPPPLESGKSYTHEELALRVNPALIRFDAHQEIARIVALN